MSVLIVHPRGLGALYNPKPLADFIAFTGIKTFNTAVVFCLFSKSINLMIFLMIASFN
jgi:hypothetical protein